MASSNGKESGKMTASIDSLKLSSKNTSKHASSESVLSKKDKECLQMQECKKKLLAMEPQIIIRDENVVLRSPPQKKIVMPPVVNPEVCKFCISSIISILYQIFQFFSLIQVC